MARLPQANMKRKTAIFMAHNDAGEASSQGSRRPTIERKGKISNSTTLPLWHEERHYALRATDKGPHCSTALHRTIPFQEDQKAANDCRYHSKRGHMREQCMLFRRLFNETLKAGEILLPERGTTNVHEAQLSRHQDRGKGHVMMACHSAANDELLAPRANQAQKRRLNR